MSVLQVAPAVKALSSEQLVKFQEDGEITVEGHTLTTEDIKVTSPWQHHHGNITMATLFTYSTSPRYRNLN